jgi:phospholipase D1/2
VPERGILARHGTHWRVEEADRVALLIDGAAYFSAVAAAMERARTSITIVGWDIRSLLLLEPETSKEILAERFVRLLDAKPELEIRLLIWDWPLALSLDRELLPQWRMAPFHDRLTFVLDDNVPVGGAAHEKVVVIDGVLAFVGGIDLSAGRWDTPDHDPANPDRMTTDRREPPAPCHDLMMLIDGAAAAAVTELVAMRWEQATDHEIAPAAEGTPIPWPDGVAAAFERQPVAIARTRPAFGDTVAVREIEALYMAAIAAAERHIYIENQYLTVVAIAEALARKLRDNPTFELVILTPKECDGPVETVVMDRGRKVFIEMLRAAAADRVAVLNTISRGVAVNVHAKMMIVDDRFITVGSANLANRSMGVDTEINLAIERASPDPVIKNWRHRLLAEHLGVTPERLAATEEREGSIISTIAALNDPNAQRHCRPLDLDSQRMLELLEDVAELVDPPEPIIVDDLPGVALPPRERRRWRRWTGRVFGAVGLIGIVVTWWFAGNRPEPVVSPWVGYPVGLALLALWALAERLWRPGLG